MRPMSQDERDKLLGDEVQEIIADRDMTLDWEKSLACTCCHWVRVKFEIKLKDIADLNVG